MKDYLVVLVLFLGGFGFAADRPNVLFVIGDDLGARLGCYGEPGANTPTLDALAKRGVMFERCYTQRPTCGPSRASMFSGLYPHESGMQKQHADFSKSRIPCTSLPSLFKQGGYQTVRVGKVFHMGIPGGIGEAGADEAAAWDVAVNNDGWDAQPEALAAMHKHGSHKNDGVRVSWLDPEIPAEKMADGVGTQAALRLMAEQHPDKTGKPLLMFMGYYRPHPPMIAPKANWDAIDTGKIRIPKMPKDDRDAFPASFLYRNGADDDFNFLPDTAGRSYVHAYHAAVNFVDGEVAKLLEGLKKNGLDKNTIIVFTGDQGFHLGEHNHWHKTSPFEPACHVPLIIVDPRKKSQDQNAQGICGLIDIYPTLCDLVGLKPKHKLSGKSLAGHLADPNLPGKPWELTEVGGATSVRIDRYRYAKNKDGAVLYDYDTDPHEHRNLIGSAELAPVVAEMDVVVEKVRAANAAAPSKKKKKKKKK